MRHDRRPAAQDGVAGQDRLIGREMEAQGVGGVAGGRYDPQLQAAERDHVPGRQPLVAQPQRRVQGTHARAGQLGEPGGALGVVRVTVGQQGERDALAGLLGGVDDMAQVALVERSGVDHDGEFGVGLGEDPGVRAVQGHRGRVGRQHVHGSRGGGAGEDPAPGLAGKGCCVGHAVAPRSGCAW